MEEELGIWNFIHGTGAGCASIAAWEGSHLLLRGGIAVAVFSVITVVIMHAVHRHRLHLKRKIGFAADPQMPNED